MKGPTERHKYDLRRVWECPDCRHRTRTRGSMTHITCECQQGKPFTEQRCMTMIEDGIRRVISKSSESPAPSSK